MLLDELDLGSAGSRALGPEIVRTLAATFALLFAFVLFFILLVRGVTGLSFGGSLNWFGLAAFVAFHETLAGAGAWMAVCRPLGGRMVAILVTAITTLLGLYHLETAITRTAPTVVWDVLEMPWMVVMAAVYLEVAYLTFRAAVAPESILRIARSSPWQWRSFVFDLLGAPPALRYIASGRMKWPSTIWCYAAILRRR